MTFDVLSRILTDLSTVPAIRTYFCVVYDYAGEADLSEGY